MKCLNYDDKVLSCGGEIGSDACATCKCYMGNVLDTYKLEVSPSKTTSDVHVAALVDGAAKTQVGGTHYTELSIQPIEVAYLINASPCFTKLAKYISRSKGNRLEDIDKALHVIELERNLTKRTFSLLSMPTRRSPRVLSYYSGITPSEAESIIKEYASQFKYFSEVYSALVEMVMGNYDKAIDAVNRLKHIELAAGGVNYGRI